MTKQYTPPSRKRYASGRTSHQGSTSCVAEGDTLYVSPLSLGRMREALAGLPSSAEPTDRMITALRAAGLQTWEIEHLVRQRDRVRVVLDSELAEYPVRNIDPGDPDWTRRKRAYLVEHPSPGSRSPNVHRGGLGWK